MTWGSTETRARGRFLRVAASLTLAATLPALAACGGGGGGGKPHYNATATLKPVAGVAKGPTGAFSAYWNNGGRRLTYKLTFAHTTGRPTQAGVYARRPGEQPLLLVRICGPCTSPRSVVLGATKVFANIFDGYLNDNKLYVVVQTKKHPQGEIRGPVRTVKGAVCEPC